LENKHFSRQNINQYVFYAYKGFNIVLELNQALFMYGGSASGSRKNSSKQFITMTDPYYIRMDAIAENLTMNSELLAL